MEINKLTFQKVLDKNKNVNNMKLNKFSIPSTLNWVENKIEALYCIMNDIILHPQCKNCNSYVKFRNYSNGYYKTCSPVCKYERHKTIMTTFHKNKSEEDVEKTVNNMKKTCIKKYGVDNYAKTDECQLKYQNTCLRNFGETNPSRSLIIKDKKEKTSLKNYGVSNPNKSQTIKDKKAKTCLDKYGFSNPSKSQTIKDKKAKTCLDKYGFENYMQTGNVTPTYQWKDYQMPSGKIIKIQGYENFLLDELLNTFEESEVLTSRTDMPQFWYVINDTKHRYFPDVYIPSTNTIYEVKSAYTLKESKKDGIYSLKMESVIAAGYNYILRKY